LHLLPEKRCRDQTAIGCNWQERFKATSKAGFKPAFNAALEFGSGRWLIAAQYPNQDPDDQGNAAGDK
jgi:hypothetical protein